jgi:hypothetical protein
MAQVDFVRCPKCQSLHWTDIPNITQRENTRYQCFRCGYRISLGACSACKTKDWLMTKGIEEKGGHRPYYRLKCRSCARVIGLLIGS